MSIGRHLLEVLVKNPEELHFQAGAVVRFSLFSFKSLAGSDIATANERESYEGGR